MQGRTLGVKPQLVLCENNSRALNAALTVAAPWFVVNRGLTFCHIVSIGRESLEESSVLNVVRLEPGSPVSGKRVGGRSGY